MMSADGQMLSEEYVQDSFHSYLKSSLTQAKIEKLLEPDVLASAEGDLMITGPALCLYFAALRSTTQPPSVPLPRRSKSSPPLDLSATNCPPTFLPFLRVWSGAVPRIQGLAPQHQHDLARIICGLAPISDGDGDGVGTSLRGIAADLRAIAIEISQRRSFQNRYAADLQAALDAGGGSSLKVKASFVPPPLYDDSRSPSSPSSSFERTPSPSILTPDSPAIEFIRETLYASLADVLERTPALRALLVADPPRAYFAAVAFAILDVASSAVALADPAAGASPAPNAGDAIVGVRGKALTLAECPPELRPLMAELCAIAREAREMSDEDDEAAMRAAMAGEGGEGQGEEILEPRLERARKILEGGVGHDMGGLGSEVSEASGRRSVEGRAVAFANRINALGMGIMRIRSFRERQAEVFAVLAGIGSGW